MKRFVIRVSAEESLFDRHSLTRVTCFCACAVCLKKLGSIPWVCEVKTRFCVCPLNERCLRLGGWHYKAVDLIVLVDSRLANDALDVIFIF